MLEKKMTKIKRLNVSKYHSKIPFERIANPGASLQNVSQYCDLFQPLAWCCE